MIKIVHSILFDLLEARKAKISYNTYVRYTAIIGMNFNIPD